MDGKNQFILHQRMTKNVHIIQLIGGENMEKALGIQWKSVQRGKIHLNGLESIISLVIHDLLKYNNKSSYILRNETATNFSNVSYYNSCYRAKSS